MEIVVGEYSAFTSDRYNCFEWEVLIFKGNKSVDLLHYNHKPTEQELKKVLERYIHNGTR